MFPDASGLEEAINSTASTKRANKTRQHCIPAQRNSGSPVYVLQALRPTLQAAVGRGASDAEPRPINRSPVGTLQIRRAYTDPLACVAVDLIVGWLLLVPILLTLKFDS